MDIVEQLRRDESFLGSPDVKLRLEAANEIEQLRAALKDIRVRPRRKGEALNIDDLVSRLQTWTGDTGTDLGELMDEAADEIERLRNELEVTRDEDRRWENLHLLKDENSKLQKAMGGLLHLWRADNAELQKALGKLIFAARYTNISPDAIKEAEAALNLASAESPTSQAIHGESRPARD